MAIEEAPDHGRREALAAIADQPFLDFQQRDVGLTANETEQIIAMRLDPVRPLIPARRRRRNFAGGVKPPNPAYGAGYAHSETHGRRVARHAPFDHSIHDTFAKIVRKRHTRRLLRAASIRNLEGSVWSRGAMRSVASMRDHIEA